MTDFEKSGLQICRDLIERMLNGTRRDDVRAQCEEAIAALDHLATGALDTAPDTLRRAVEAIAQSDKGRAYLASIVPAAAIEMQRGGAVSRGMLASIRHRLDRLA